MTKTIDDLLILLRNKTEAVSSKQLAYDLGETVPARTLRRWLKQLVDEGKVTTTGQYKSTRYQASKIDENSISSTLQALTEQQHPFFSKQSLELIAKVKRPLYERTPCSYNQNWLESYVPNQTFYLTTTQRQLLAENSKRSINQLPTGTYTLKIYDRILVDLSYNSSRLEGNTYSLAETEHLVLEGIAATEKMDRDRVMILNHKEAIRFLVEGISRVNCSEENIRTLHYLLADGLVAVGQAGNIRQDGVRVSATTYMPLENHKLLSTLLTDLCQKASAIRDPFEQSFFLLVHISYLQAFIDVNKRTARLAANIPLIKHSLVPIAFNDISTNDYIDCVIASYELNQTSPLSEMYTWSYSRSCENYRMVSDALGIDLVRIKYRQQRRTIIAEIVKIGITPNNIPDYIFDYANKNISESNRNKFIADTLQELENLSVHTIAGLGISRQEFEKWQKLSS